MKFSELPNILREAMALYELYRKLGFKAEEIFASYNKDQGLMLGIETQGKSSYFRIGSLGNISKDEFAALWRDACECINTTASQDEVDLMYSNSLVCSKYDVIALTLHGSGLVIPNVTKLMMAKAEGKYQVSH